MDHSMKRLRAARQLSIGMAALFAAEELAREAYLEKVALELKYLGEELVHLHRKLLDLPSKAPSRAQLLQDDEPF